jgi:hypothetical protein
MTDERQKILAEVTRASDEMNAAARLHALLGTKDTEIRLRLAERAFDRARQRLLGEGEDSR